MEVLSLFKPYCSGCARCEVETIVDEVRCETGEMYRIIKVGCTHRDLCERVANETANTIRETLKEPTNEKTCKMNHSGEFSICTNCREPLLDYKTYAKYCMMCGAKILKEGSNADDS